MLRDLLFLVWARGLQLYDGALRRNSVIPIETGP